jgi:class 3 adenylate cyclase
MPVPETTVTFFFSDIEGSTRLLDHLGVRYAEVLREHRELVRAAIVSHAGRELGTAGDGFSSPLPRRAVPSSPPPRSSGRTSSMHGPTAPWSA